MAVKKELVDELLKDADPKKVFGSEGLLDEIKKALAERMLNAELDEHLAAESAEADSAAGAGNHRNGYSKKTVLTDTGKLELDIPRDRRGSFDPQLIGKYQRRFPGFDEKIVSMYARGMSVREIQGHLRELYGIEASPQLVSTVTDAVLDEVAKWQSRPLEAVYAIVFFDALRVKIRDEGTVRNKAVYLAVGVLPEGKKDVLGLWIEQTEGAKFWLRVMTELKNRGRGRRPDHGGRRPEGLPRGDQRGVPPGAGPDLHRAPDPLLDGICFLEGAQSRRRRPEDHLPGRDRSSRPGRAGGLRSRSLGSALSGDRRGLATQLGAGDPVLRLSARGASDHLYDQCDREPEQSGASVGACPRTLPDRRGGEQADLVGVA